MYVKLKFDDSNYNHSPLNSMLLSQLKVTEDEDGATNHHVQHIS